jgi:uncharacterized membrane protein YccC
MATVVTSTNNRAVIARSLMIGLLGGAGSFIAGPWAVLIASIVAAVTAQPGQRVRAFLWAVLGGLALLVLLVLLVLPFITPTQVTVGVE